MERVKDKYIPMVCLVVTLLREKGRKDNPNLGCLFLPAHPISADVDSFR